MGFAASQARLLGLVARQSDLQLESQFISQHRMYLANMVSGMFGMQAKLDPDSAAAKLLEARIQSLQQADKMLEMHLNRIQSQHTAVEQELQDVRKIIDKNIENSFGKLSR